MDFHHFGWLRSLVAIPMNPFASGFLMLLPWALAIGQRARRLVRPQVQQLEPQGLGFYAFLGFSGNATGPYLTPFEMPQLWEGSMASPQPPNLFQDIPTCLENYWVLRPKRDRSTSRGRPKDREEAGDYLEGGGLCKRSEGFLIEDPKQDAKSSISDGWSEHFSCFFLAFERPWAKPFQTFGLGIRLRWWRGSGWGANEEAKGSSPQQWLTI